MARSGAILTGLVLFAAALVGVPTSATADSEQAWVPTDFITLDSAPDHFPGDGRSLSWSGDDISYVEAANGFLIVGVGDEQDPTDPKWSWMFRAPEGQSLQVGDYENADGSTIMSDRPGILVGGDGRGCNEASGRFRIMELAPDLSRVRILYEHRCGVDDPSVAAWGEIRIGMPDVDSDAEFLPNPFRLPDWYPGLDAGAQPVTLFNTGQNPLAVTNATVLQGQSEFRVESGLASCAELAPRESCRIFIVFRPAVAGDRTGQLRLTTSLGSLDLPLTGYGYPGLTEFRIKPAGGPETVVTPDAWLMRATNTGVVQLPERVAGFYGWDGDDVLADRSSIIFEAPAAGFEAGKTYSACCGDLGPDLSIEIAGEGESGPGTYTVHEVAYDADGVLARFSASFRLYDDRWVVGTVAWRASSPPPMPAFPPDDAASPLTVEPDRSTYDAGDVAVVTVTVPGGAGQEVTLYAGRDFGGPHVVGTKSTDASGRARYEVPLTSEHSFLAASGAHTGMVYIEVVQHPRVIAKGFGHVGRNGKYLRFRAGKPAHLAGAATPVLGEECLYLEVQRRDAGGWRPVELADPCLWVVEGAVGETTLRGKPGARKRVRLHLNEVPHRPAATSNWVYMEFVRRAG